MSKPKFSDIFAMCIHQELFNLIADRVIEKCNLDTENRSLTIELGTENYIEKETQLKIQNELKDALRLSACEVSFAYSEDAFCNTACADIAAELKIKNPALNGYFAGADYALSGDTVNITLKHGGYKKICECEFEKSFKNVLRSRFN